jgi:AcrR family transcriptional regulator
MSQTTLDHTADPGSTSKGARTRQAILAAAIARFGREGFRATSVADVTRDAGVGGTVAYAYFDNKESLFLAALDEDAAGLIRTGLDHLEAHEPRMAPHPAVLRGRRRRPPPSPAACSPAS